MQNVYLSHEECAERWPRLVKACQEVAVLSSGEAACGIRDYRAARIALAGINPFPSHPDFSGDHLSWWGNDQMLWGGGEAVAHFGGPKKLIEAAIRRKRRWHGVAEIPRYSVTEQLEMACGSLDMSYEIKE